MAGDGRRWQETAGDSRRWQEVEKASAPVSHQVRRELGWEREEDRPAALDDGGGLPFALRCGLALT